jgi:hypothetical protein
MKVQTLALCAIALALAGAEIARPTTFHSKRVSHASLLGIVARPALDQSELDNLPPIVTPAIGNIDAVFVIEAGRTRPLTADATVPRDATIRLVGWCADPQAREPGFLLLAVVDGKRRIDVTRGYRIKRPDVAIALQTPALLDSGFAIDLPAAEFASGPHEVRVAVVTADQRSVTEFPTVVRFRNVGGS